MSSFERIGAFVVTAELDADKVEPFWTSLTKDFAALDASTFTPGAIGTRQAEP